MLSDLSIKSLAEKLTKKELSSVELINEFWERTEKLNPKLNCFINLNDKERLLKAAEEADRSRSENSSVLHGIPFAAKDAYVNTETKTTCASKVLEDFHSPYDATVLEKLKKNKAILFGKNNQDAWGHGGSTENTDFGPCHNPWNIEHVAGGSSGGSAASISARLVPFAIGEDTGGSIRNPSSMCNVSGLKVSYGRVSRFGAIAYASSLDTVGPMAKSVEDLAYILKEIVGIDTNDATSAKQKPDDYPSLLNRDIKGKIIGIPEEYFNDLSQEIKDILNKAISQFENLGLKIVRVSLPSVKYQVPGYYLIALSETSSNLARYDGVRYGNDRNNFTTETMRRIILGTHALSAGYADELYKKAQKLRTKFINEYSEALNKCDIMLCPVVAGEAPKIGELINDPVRNLLEDLYTVTINLVGVPSLAIPAGFTENNFPIGMQLIGPMFSEGQLLNIGHQYQQVTDWHKRKPTILDEK